jgi:hypothetical protein
LRSRGIPGLGENPQHQHTGYRANHLRSNESWNVSRPDSRERVARGSANGDGGFAKEVEAVNQYAAPIQSETRHAASPGDRARNAMNMSPLVATASEGIAPHRSWHGSTR